MKDLHCPQSKGSAVKDLNGLAMSAPRLSQEFRSLALDCLYRLAKSFPNDFSSEHVDLLKVLIPVDPSKSLAILVEYSQHLSDIANPIDITDLLSNPSFLNPTSALDYVRFIWYLLTERAEFKNNHISKYITYLLAVFRCRHPPAITAACSILQTFERPLTLDDHLIGRHLLNPELTPSIIELILTTKSAVGPRIVSGIVHHLRPGPPYFALLSIARSRSARALIQSPGWLESNLKPVAILKLFIVVMLHSKLRRPLVQLKEAINFLCELASIRNVAVATLMFTLLRRLVTSEEDLIGFRRTHFISVYFASVKELNDSSALEAALLVLDGFAETGYMEDYVGIVPELREILKRADRIAVMALGVVVKLARFRELRAAMLECRFPAYFERIAKRGYERQAAAFEANWKRRGED
jgi:hypothetical protein